MAARPAAGRRLAAPRPLTRFAQAEARRYRLRYTKLGQAAYLAHLDLVRHLPRVFRRAGLDIAYSRGFHPKPGLCFGPALGLGMPSLGELLDVKLGDEVTPAELLRRLNAVSLTGIEFLAAAALQESEPALGRVLARAQYAVWLPDGAERRGGSCGLCLGRAPAGRATRAPGQPEVGACLAGGRAAVGHRRGHGERRARASLGCEAGLAGRHARQRPHFRRGGQRPGQRPAGGGGRSLHRSICREPGIDCAAGIVGRGGEGCARKEVRLLLTRSRFAETRVRPASLAGSGTGSRMPVPLESGDGPSVAASAWPRTSCEPSERFRRA